MKTIKELKEERGAALKSMTALVEERGESMNEETLATIKSFKDDIDMLDSHIAVIDDMRSIAMRNSISSGVGADDARKEIRSNFHEFLRGRHNITEKQFEEAVRFMHSGGTGSGAELVPDEFYKVLEEAILEFSDFKSDAFNFTTGDNGVLTMPSIDDTANTGAWLSEGGPIPLADASTSDRTMSVYKVGSGVKLSTELIEDSFFNIETWVARAIGTRLAKTFNASFINGDGIAKPLGILIDSTVKSIDSIASLSVTHKDAINLRYALQISSRIGGVYYASDSMIKEMELWEDANGRPLLQPSDVATQANGILYTLWGYPVKLNTELGDIVAGDSPLIFGNPSKYMIRNVRAITIKRNEYSSMGTDEVEFYGTTRLDGKLTDTNDTFSKLVIKA